MNTHQLPQAINILEQLLDRPEPEPADYNGQLIAAIAPHQIRLLQEACSYAHDWDAARDEDRGPSPYASYVKEIQLAEAIVKTHQSEVRA